MKRYFVILIVVLLIAGCELNFIKKRLPPPYKTKEGVVFQYEAPSARMVTLAGDFPDNLWGGTASTSAQYDPNIDKMYDDGTHGDLEAGDGIWTLVKKLTPGRYTYKYVVDRNSWFTDPNALDYTDDGYGGKNSVLVVE